MTTAVPDPTPFDADLSDVLDPARAIVVVGLMGAGKSTVASALAQATGRILHDSDVDILLDTGRTAAQIAASDGVDALHRREADQLLRWAGEPVVVAAAASVLDDPACRQVLGGAVVVWPDAPPHVLAERFASGPHRPRFGPDVLAMLQQQDARRRPVLDRVATVRLDATRAPQDVVAAALRAVGAVRGGSDRSAGPGRP